MKKINLILSLLIATLMLSCSNCQKEKNENVYMEKKAENVMRQGMVIGVNPEKLEEYKELHANPWQEVDSMLKAANIQNYSIYLKDNLLFGYWEYTGTDYDADMKMLGEHPKVKEWLTLTDPCQVPLESREEGEWWSMMEEVYHLD